MFCSPALTRRRLILIRLTLALLVVCLAVTATAQFRRGFSNVRLAGPTDFDGHFHFCRLVYQGNGRGGSWTTDFPRADINMSIRLSELTRTNVSFNASGQPNHMLVRAPREELFQCPIHILATRG